MYFLIIQRKQTKYFNVSLDECKHYSDDSSSVKCGLKLKTIEFEVFQKAEKVLTRKTGSKNRFLKVYFSKY